MKEISAQEAFDQMQKSPDAIYLDVRSVPEFEQGHPPGALNIPIMHFIPGMGMSPNGDFATVVEASVPKNAELIVGCKSGGRSAHACQILQGMGYANVVNVRSGFVGAMDNYGRMAEPGWSLLNLPVCTDCKETTRYDHLAANAKK